MLPQLPDKAHSLVLSYRGIRRAIGVCGLLLPVLLGLGGWLFYDIGIQDNLSSYYHTPMRDVFVGIMSAIGIFLFCYRGYDWIENWTANIGCLAALGVAFCPLEANSDPLHQKSIVGYIHTMSGGVFFMTFALYSLFHFPRKTSTEKEGEPHPAERVFIYRTSGIVILLSMLAMGAYLLLLPEAWIEKLNDYNFLFWMEGIAIWAFAAAWLTKGRTIIAEIAVEIMAIPHELLLKHANPTERD